MKSKDVETKNRTFTNKCITKLSRYQAGTIFCFILFGFTNLSAQNTKRDSTHGGVIIDRFPMPPPENDSNKIYIDVQVKPEFQGDISKFFTDNIQYPDSARQNNIQGSVYLDIVIEKDGSISNITVLRSPDVSLSKEAIRAVSTMPKWMPGKQNGVPVRVYVNIPVRFKLK